MADAKPLTPKPAVPAITPFAFRETKLRPGMIARIKELQPEGNPDKAQLENARAFVLAEIDALPADVNGVEVSIEAHIGPAARQTNIIVWPKKF